MENQFIYHITTPASWAAAENEAYFEAPSLQAEGFIHTSTQAQARTTANRYFNGEEKIVLIKIEADKLEAELKYDWVESQNQSFPHIYGPLNKSAIVEVAAVPCKEDGQFDW